MAAFCVSYVFAALLLSQSFSSRCDGAGGDQVIVPGENKAGGARATINSINLGKGQYLDMVSMTAGTFQMGTDDFGWVKHYVTLTKGFSIARYPVTVGQWKQVMMTDVDPSYFKKGDNYPVENVNWFQCKKFIDNLNERYFAYGTFRFPTEAEWEFACRAGSTSYFYWGDKMNGNYCWYHDNSGNATHPVGQKLPNNWGLYDMSGNVWEWCDDWMAPYTADTLENPVGPGNGLIKVLRGGSWNTYSNKNADTDSWYYSAGNCRSGDRGGADPSYRFSFVGFRIALTPAGK